MRFRHTRRAFKSHQLGRSHINPMAPRVGRINCAKVTLKQQNPHGTPAFRERFYVSKMKQTLRTLRHQHIFNICFHRTYEGITMAQDIQGLSFFVRNKHKSPSLSDGHHHHANSFKSRIPLAHRFPYPLEVDCYRCRTSL